MAHQVQLHKIQSYGRGLCPISSTFKKEGKEFLKLVFPYFMDYT